MRKKDIKRKIKSFLKAEKGSIGKIQAIVLGLGSVLVSGEISKITEHLTEHLAELKEAFGPNEALGYYDYFDEGYEDTNYPDYPDYEDTNYPDYPDYEDTNYPDAYPEAPDPEPDPEPDYPDYYDYSDYDDYSDYSDNVSPKVDDVTVT